jgi:hypothetical protein
VLSCTISGCPNPLFPHKDRKGDHHRKRYHQCVVKVRHLGLPVLLSIHPWRNGLRLVTDSGPVFSPDRNPSQAALENLRQACRHRAARCRFVVIRRHFRHCLVSTHGRNKCHPRDYPESTRLGISIPDLDEDDIRQCLGVTQWALGLSPLVILLPRLSVRYATAQFQKLRAFAAIG